MSTPPLAQLQHALAPEIYGGKAAGLAAAVRAGLPVPGGFAIAADALADLWAGCAAEGLRAELGEMLAELGPGPLAVRSSAVGEDTAAASFAGQHTSVLGPSDGDAVLAALARVHDSAHTEAAAAYRQRMDLPISIGIGAVIQRLVAAEVAGVMFTRDPAGGERIVVEASFGLGESVVAGLITPDHFELGRDGTLLAQRIGAKDIAVRIDPAAGATRRESVSAAIATRPCLSARELERLAELARRAEDALGRGQDVEWAFAHDQFHLLQSRPIGTPERPHADANKSTGTDPHGRIPSSPVDQKEQRAMQEMPLQGKQLSARQSHQLRVAPVAKTFSLPLWSVLVGGSVICVGLAFGVRALGQEALGVPSDLPSLAASALLAAAIFPVLGNCFGYFMSFRAKPNAHSMRLFLGIGTIFALVGVAISASKLPRFAEHGIRGSHVRSQPAAQPAHHRRAPAVRPAIQASRLTTHLPSVPSRPRRQCISSKSA